MKKLYNSRDKTLRERAKFFRFHQDYYPYCGQFTFLRIKFNNENPHSWSLYLSLLGFNVEFRYWKHRRVSPLGFSCFRRRICTK